MQNICFHPFAKDYVMQVYAYTFYYFYILQLFYYSLLIIAINHFFFFFNIYLVKAIKQVPGGEGALQPPQNRYWARRAKDIQVK